MTDNFTHIGEVISYIRKSKTFLKQNWQTESVPENILDKLKKDLNSPPHT